MQAYSGADAPIQPIRPSIDARALWAGGAATAVVAALAAVVGVMIARGLFHIPVLAPERAGAIGDASTLQLAGWAALAALLATGLMHVLLLATPRPKTFFGWIVGLTTVLAVVWPFATGAPLAAKAATAVIYLVIGAAIGSLISGVAAWAVRRAPVQVDRVR